MKGNIGILLVSLMVGTALLASPGGSIIWGTTSRDAGVISNLTQALATGNGTGANAMAAALGSEAQQAQQDVQALYAVNTMQLSASDMQAYTAALNNFNLVLRSAVAVLYAAGYKTTAQAYANTVNALIDYVSARGAIDPVFGVNAVDSPGGGTIWGTTGKYPQLP